MQHKNIGLILLLAGCGTFPPAINPDSGFPQDTNANPVDSGVTTVDSSNDTSMEDMPAGDTNISDSGTATDSCTPVTNSIFDGIGIHKLSNGWIYNVSGLKSIELSFKDRFSTIRIGTNRPDEISDYITRLINHNKSLGSKGV